MLTNELLQKELGNDQDAVLLLSFITAVGFRFIGNTFHVILGWPFSRSKGDRKAERSEA